MRALFIGCLALAACAQAQADDRRVVPDLVGKSPEEANAALHAAGFDNDLEVDSAALDCGDHPPKVEERHVLCQKPAAGEMLRRSGYVYVVTYHDARSKDVLYQDQLQSLIGLTIPDAKAKLKQMGYDGQLEIRVSATYQAQCGLDKVCGTEPMTAVNKHDRLRLFVNPKVDIAAPPP
jgi:beta-lactam-binding protein with PASTA domain